jgi:hypothetical protein
MNVCKKIINHNLNFAESVHHLKNKLKDQHSLKVKLQHDQEREIQERTAKAAELEKIRSEQRQLPDQLTLRKNKLQTLKQDVALFAAGKVFCFNFNVKSI